MRQKSVIVLLTMCLMCMMLQTSRADGLAFDATTPPVVYEVAFVPEDFALNVWDNPSAYKTIDTLQNGDTVQITGPADTHYLIARIPITYRDGKAGWVNSAYITGNVGTARFCGDSRPKSLIAALQKAVQKRDGKALADLIAPQGLYLNLEDENAVHLSIDEVRGFFGDRTMRNWGPDYGGGPDRMKNLAVDVAGLLNDDLLPKNVQLACNDNQDRLTDTSTLGEIALPGYTIDNFYSVMRPGAPGYELNWGAWGIGVVYWNDQPKIIALAHYIWTP